MANRFSPQSQQELASRHQLSEYLNNFGWIASSVDPDLGEDFLVRVYENNKSTGLSCYMQLKSTTDIKSLKRKNSKFAYRFDVKDLIHWQISATPVILVIWDIVEKTGFWCDIDVAIKYLNTNRKGWKNNKTTTVYFSLGTDFGVSGLKLLKQVLIKKSEPTMMKRDPLHFTFQFAFPNTVEGKEKQKELSRAIDYGDEFEVTGEYIRDIQVNEWYKRLYGFSPPTEKTYIKWEASSSSEPLHISLETLLSGKQLKTIPYIKLMPKKIGSLYASFTNKNNSKGLVFTVIFDKSGKTKTNFSYSLHDTRMNVRDALSALEFWNSMAIADTLKIKILNSDEVLESHISDADRNEKANKGLIDLLEKACFIQEKTDISLSLDKFEIEEETAKAIFEIESVCRQGFYLITGGELTFDVPRNKIEEFTGNFLRESLSRMKVTQKDCQISMLNATIPLGDAEWNVNIKLVQSQEYLQKILTNKNNVEDIPIRFTIEEGRAVFHDWINN